jgi:sugar phosphate isomerase/epimerase
MDTETSLRSRAGLNVPYEWWPASPLLKEIEACGFSWIQLPSPPPSVLTDPRACIRHAAAAAQTLSTTSLRAVLHTPTSLLAGTAESDRVLEGTLSYAAECGAEQIVYHARALPDEPRNTDRLLAETRSLARAALLAERLGLTIAVENLAPVFPGPLTVSAIPINLRSLVRRLDSPAVRICLDVGHANVVAGLRRTALSGLTDPVLDLVSLFHLHDNLGGRWRATDQRPELDPLRLDLHLVPGRGSIPWQEIAPGLLDHSAPLLLEIHPAQRQTPRELRRALETTLLSAGRRHARSGFPAPSPVAS